MMQTLSSLAGDDVQLQCAELPGASSLGALILAIRDGF